MEWWEREPPPDDGLDPVEAELQAQRQAILAWEHEAETGTLYGMTWRSTLPVQRGAILNHRFRGRVRALLQWEEVFSCARPLWLTRRSNSQIPYVSLCWLHDERTPSLFYSFEGRWWCMGCGNYGDVADFISIRLGIGRPSELQAFFRANFPILAQPANELAQERRSRYATQRVTDPVTYAAWRYPPLTQPR